MGTHIPTKEQSLHSSKKTHPLTRDAFWVWKKPEADEENPGLRPIFAVLRRQVALIVGVAVVVTTASAAWTATRIPKYEGRFQIMVEPLKTSDSELLKLLSQTLQQNVNDITRQNTTALDYNALLEVLKSPKLIDPVVRELQVKYPEITYDQLVGNDGSGKVSSNREGTLLMNRIAKGKDESRIIEVRYRDAKPQKIAFVLDEVSQAYRKYSIEQQQTSLRQGMKFVEQQIPKLQLRVNTLQGQLQSFQQRYSLYSPQLQGEQLLKRLDDIKAQRLEQERKFVEARSLYTSLQNQLGLQQNEAIAASALSESPQYQQILTRIREIEAKIASASVRFSEASPQIQDLREERQKLLPLLNREARLALGSTPGQSLPASVATYQNSVRRDLTKQLADSTNQMQSLDASLRALVQAEFQLNEQIQQYPVVSRQYSNLQRDLQVATDTLNQLLTRQEALRVDAAQQEVPWEVIMPPTLPRNKNGQYVAVSPAASGNLMLGAVAGLLLGTAAAFVLENLKNVIRDPDEAKRVAKIPHLGSIPFCRNNHIPVVASNVIKFDAKSSSEFEVNAAKTRNEKNPVFAQAFCSIYNRVQAYSIETQIRSIAVTSATAGEGRTTVAANLALIAAEAGQKVLLVDADLRQPSLHMQMGISNGEGFSEVLSQNLDLNLAVTRSHSEENLFILTAGKAKVNPSKMFSSNQMENFIAESQANFDLVIYDTPYLLGRLDTNVLADRVDGILLVVGLGKAVRPNFKQVVEELRATRGTILGMVTNNLNCS